MLPSMREGIQSKYMHGIGHCAAQGHGLVVGFE